MAEAQGRARGRARGRGTINSSAASVAVAATDSPNVGVEQFGSITSGVGAMAIGGAANVGQAGGVQRRGPLNNPLNKPRRRRDDFMEGVITYPTRPKECKEKIGSAGRGIKCVSNFVPVLKRPDFLIYQYHVTFIPAVDSRMIQRELINQQLEIIGKHHLFNGTTFFTKQKLPESAMNLKSTNSLTQEVIHIELKLTGELPPVHPQCLTIFNICNRQALDLLDYKQVGRHYFNPKESRFIQEYQLEIWPGFVSSIRSHDCGLLMGCDMVHKLLRKDTVLDFLYGLFDMVGKDPFYEKATSCLVGTSVITRYNSKTYRIDEILWDKRVTDTFMREDGSTCTYLKYYQDTYGRQIKDLQQPLLLSRAKKRGIRKTGAAEKDGKGTQEPMDLFLVPEFCAMTGITETMRADRGVMRALATETRASPIQRIEKVQKHLNNLHGNSAVVELMHAWGLQFDVKPLDVDARVLPMEELSMGNRKFMSKPLEADWSREMRGLKCNLPIMLNNWVLIYGKRDYQMVQEFVAALRRTTPEMGMGYTQPNIVELESDRHAEYIHAINQSCEKLPDIVVAVVPNDNKDRYDAIKKVCCIDLGVASQVVNVNTLKKGKNLGSIVTKIALQMNVKMGGALWSIGNPLKKGMVVGYDAYHDSANKRQSVGAAVFSLDPELSTWYSQCALHTESQELVDNLTIFMRNALLAFHNRNQFLPDRIMFYRDGVGDGQLQVVNEYEVPQILDSFRAIDPNYEPKLTFLVINKKINVRFFEKVGNALQNPPPGTVVDSSLTLPERYDFYMVPQCCRTGTVSPISVNVLRDESALVPDQLQRFTYKLCHLYYNWQGCIRVPAPVQYASKLAFLVGQSLHQPPDSKLSNRLYFL